MLETFKPLFRAMSKVQRKERKKCQATVTDRKGKKQKKRKENERKGMAKRKIRKEGREEWKV